MPTQASVRQLSGPVGGKVAVAVLTSKAGDIEMRPIFGAR